MTLTDSLHCLFLFFLGCFLGCAFIVVATLDLIHRGHAQARWPWWRRHVADQFPGRGDLP